MESDLWGRALLDFHLGNRLDPLTLHTSFDNPELVPLEIFFRDQSEFTELELLACDLCQGTILDIGAGTGCHSLVLQERGFNITSLEKSAGACEVMRLNGVKNVIQGDIFTHTTGKFDTALMMMNGLGLAGRLENLPLLLSKVMSCLKPTGQIIADSSDIAYLYRDIPIPTKGYYGELEYYYEYQGKSGDIFPWLFVDFGHLQRTTTSLGLKAQLLFEEEDQYLAIIKMN